MDYRTNNNRGRVAPQREQAAVSQGQSPVSVSNNGAPQRKESSKKKFLVGGLVVLLLALAVAAHYLWPSQVDQSKYQAVFLTNGQVYFGKLSGWNTAQPTLTDVYYFQASGDTTGADSESPEAADTSTQTLIKLGEEIHKPSDKLIFNRESILFVENIEDDGQVVEAIKKNQETE